MMADDQLPSEFDVIILGTGLTESIAAASLSRVGKKVLHLDRNQYYGGQLATFSFDELLEWISKHDEVGSENEDDHQADNESVHVEKDDNIDLISIQNTKSAIKNITVRSFIKEDGSLSPKETFLVAEGMVEECSNEREINFDEVLTEQKSFLEKEVKARESPFDDMEAQTKEFDEEKSKNKSNQTILNESNVLDVANSSDQLNHEMCSNTDPLSVSTSDQHNDNFENENETNNVGGEVRSDTDMEVDFNVVSNEPSQPATTRLEVQAKIASHSPNVTLNDLKSLSRKFNIDLTSKLMFARGSLIESIINANICHYAEFRTAERLLTYKDGEIVQVPCSRADVFSSDMVSMIEKRVLMKFLSFCLIFDEQPEEYSDFSDRPFIEFLQHKRLSVNLQHFIIYCIAMTKPSVKTVFGLQEAQQFLRSLGRYSNSPFVLPLYGAGELPQAFCRMSAVFGGTYCLHRKADYMIVDKNSKLFKGIVCKNDQKISGTHLIMEQSYLPETWKKQEKEFVSRAILITNKSLKDFQTEPVTLLTIPPIKENNDGVRVIEIGPASMACPIGLFVVHLTTTAVQTAEKDLQPYVDILFHQLDEDEANKPGLLWSVFFNQDSGSVNVESNLPDNVFATSFPDGTLHFNNAVKEAREIFERICPNCDFLPAVPNPEDIIWDDTYRQLGPGASLFEEDQETDEHQIDGNEADTMQRVDEVEVVHQDAEMSQEIIQQNIEFSPEVPSNHESSSNSEIQNNSEPI